MKLLGRLLKSTILREYCWDKSTNEQTYINSQGHDWGIDDQFNFMV